MATPQEKAEFARRQAERVKQAEQVVAEQQAANEICNGCGKFGRLGRIIKGFWYCYGCKSEKQHIAEAEQARGTRSMFGGRS